MSEKSIQTSKGGILKSLKYLVLSAMIIIAATGISNAETFTVTADVGCDPSIDPGSPGTLIGVSVVTTGSDSFTVTGTTIDFGEVEQNQTESVTFSLDIEEPTLCNGDLDTFTLESITVNGTAVDSYSCEASIPCTPFATEAVVGIMFPAISGPYSESIEFSYTP